MGPPLLLQSLSGPFKIQNHPTCRPCKGSGVIKILNNAKCNILFFNNKIQTVHFIDSKMIFFFCILIYRKLGCILQLIACHGLIGIALTIFFPLYTK